MARPILADETIALCANRAYALADRPHPLYAGLLPAGRWAAVAAGLGAGPWLAALVNDADGRPERVFLLCDRPLAQQLRPAAPAEAARLAALWLRGRRWHEAAGGGELADGLPAALDFDLPAPRRVAYGRAE
jgi:hypothetical protein